MHVMYVAPRFHTNQSDIVKGWIEQGDQVTFVTYYKAPIEDYTDIQPIVLGFSPLYYVVDWVYMNIIKKNDPANTAFKINHGFPPLFKVGRILKKKKPDLVIMRDRTLYSMVVYVFCKLYRYPTVLYNQSPLWDAPPKKDIMHRLVYKLTPKIRITPVMGFRETGKMVSEDSYFVPFVQRARIKPEKKQYFVNGNIEVLMVGKFEPRKNHLMLIQVVHELQTKYPGLHLTIIGEATGRLQKKFLQVVENYVLDNRLDREVSIYTNVPRGKMNEFYEQSDVFVIPSTKEMASISQLEAMSFSLPVIISDKNGAVQYVEDGVNGHWFRDSDKESLYEKMDNLLASREKIMQMGKESYRLIVEKYQFKNYYQELMNACKSEE